MVRAASSLCVALFWAGAMACSAAAPAPPLPPAPPPCRPPAAGLSLQHTGATLWVCLEGAPIAAFRHAEAGWLTDATRSGKRQILVVHAPAAGRPRRFHLHRLGAQGLQPLWRGSGMSGRVDAYGLLPATRKRPARIVTVEANRPAWRAVVYGWKQFGFAGMCSAPLQAAGARWPARFEVTCPDGTVVCRPASAPGQPTLECRIDDVAKED